MQDTDFFGLAWAENQFPHLPEKKKLEYRSLEQKYYLAGIRCERDGLLTQALRCYTRCLLIESESANTRLTRQIELHERMRVVLDAIHRVKEAAGAKAQAHRITRERRGFVDQHAAAIEAHDAEFQRRARKDEPIKAKSQYVRERIKQIRAEQD